jgi:hypothetical protein
MAREKNFDRNYSDESGILSIAHGEDTVAELALDALTPSVLRKAALRYCGDVLVGTANAAYKGAKEAGKTDDEAHSAAVAAIEKTTKALTEETFRFRSASGTGGLSTEEEFGIIADVLVANGKATSKEDGVAKAKGIFERTKKNAKGYTVRPEYNALRNVPAVKLALAQANKKGDGFADIAF